MTGHCYNNDELDLDGAARSAGEQLSLDNPVALLIMQNESLKDIAYIDAYGKPASADLRFHWIVITSMMKRAGRTVVEASSEGSKVSMDFKDVWNCSSDSPFGWRGIAYFDVAG